MEILFKNELAAPPKVSFILLDWSCRESFHTLDYLNDQALPRSDYEILWIEFYTRRAPEIARYLEADLKAGRPPPVDQWIVLDFPEALYYHKHLMYNVGLAAARGGIVTFCDSDAMVRPTFVQSIVETFEKQTAAADSPGIVLHHDEVRTADRRHYPFDHPAFEDLLSGPCLNWNSEAKTTTGLMDNEDPLHTLNYGACMSARRSDLIALGGADEHADYLGHVCGPYEMTWRLVNSGQREVWHPSEFLYRTWHPGTEGSHDHRGPHDGRNISTTALANRVTGRTSPFRENAAIRLLREGEESQDNSALVQLAVDQADTACMQKPPGAALPRLTVLDASFLSNAAGSFFERARSALATHRTPSDLARTVFITPFNFLRELVQQNGRFHINCETFLDNLDAEKIPSIALFGEGEVAEKLSRLMHGHNVQIKAVYGPNPGATAYGLRVQDAEKAVEFAGPIVIGSRHEAEYLAGQLRTWGVDVDRIRVIL
ncbi:MULTISPECIES: glycosyltransferase [unclassified Nitrospina]|uniref:glycosyltransferase n=1 Tax=unclassified Nitrospina TaxID=2638683 RepID=UPI003F9848BC